MCRNVNRFPNTAPLFSLNRTQTRSSNPIRILDMISVYRWLPVSSGKKVTTGSLVVVVKPACLISKNCFFPARKDSVMWGASVIERQRKVAYKASVIYNVCPAHTITANPYSAKTRRWANVVLILGRRSKALFGSVTPTCNTSECFDDSEKSIIENKSVKLTTRLILQPFLN